MRQLSNPMIMSVIVPVHNGGEDFRRCLAALARGVALEGDQRIEIIVVADGDSDGSWRIAQDYGARLIRQSVSQGPAKARNAGAAAAKGDLLFFVDADVEIHSDTLSRILAGFEADPELAALIGSYDDAPGASNFLSQYKNLLHHYTHQQAYLEASTFWGACGAIRRPIFEAVGGFNESYRRPCVEDIELGYRLRQHGYKINLRKDIQVKHLKRWLPYSLLRADVFYRALPWMALLLSIRQQHPAHYRLFTRDLNLKWDSRISVMLVFALVFTLMASPWHPAGVAHGLAIGALLALLLVVVNYRVYEFFCRKRGLWFALQTVPWHWLYFFYSGLAYGVSLIRHQFRLYSLSR